jgi:hypothetical protein
VSKKFRTLHGEGFDLSVGDFEPGRRLVSPALKQEDVEKRRSKHEKGFLLTC